MKSPSVCIPPSLTRKPRSPTWDSNAIVTVLCTSDEPVKHFAVDGTRSAVASAVTAAAAYGCVDWYIYPDSGDVSRQSEAADAA